MQSFLPFSCEYIGRGHAGTERLATWLSRHTASTRYGSSRQVKRPGLHRRTLAVAFSVPLNKPYFIRANLAYSEQCGSMRHCRLTEVGTKL